MTEATVHIVRHYYEAVNRADDEAVRELFSEDVVADASRRLVEPGVWRGRAEVMAAAAQVREAWDTLVLVPEELIPSGDRVVAVVLNKALGRNSGVAVESRTAQVWTVREGRITRFEYFGTPEEAFEAVGLPAR
jgi:ketosteroid isomerase-like protein